MFSVLKIITSSHIPPFSNIFYKQNKNNNKDVELREKLKIRSIEHQLRSEFRVKSIRALKEEDD